MTPPHEAAARGRNVVTRQRYEVQSEMAVGDRVAVQHHYDCFDPW